MSLAYRLFGVSWGHRLSPSVLTLVLVLGALGGVFWCVIR